jgi:hypothetical protein
METGLSTELRGPHISGTVSVPLAELDRMRVDHANAVKLANELADNAMKVKVTIVEKHFGTKRNDDNYGRPYYVPDEKYTEVGAEYRGLDTVRKVIRLEEQKVLDGEMTVLNQTINDLRKQLGDSKDLNHKVSIERKDLLNEVTELKKTLKEREDYVSELIDDNDALLEKIDQAMENNLDLRELLEKERNKKPFWKGFF